jgi:signal peptidase II
MLSISFALMLSGAIGNLIDRVLFGYVIDFLDFHWLGSHFPAFNVADSMIFIGAALMLLDAYLHPEVKDESQTEKNNIV